MTEILKICLSGILGILIGFLYSYSLIKANKKYYGALRIIITAVIISYLLHLGVIPFIILNVTFLVTLWLVLIKTL